MLEKSVLELIPAGRDVSIERDVFPRLVGEGLFSRRLEGYWMDIGTPERYLESCWDILCRRVETEPGARVDGDCVYVDAAAGIAPDTEIRGPAFVEAGASVAAGARIGPRAVIGAGCEIGERARLSGTALHPGCTIGAGAVCEEAILARGAIVAEGATVPRGAVIGAGATITASASLGPGARVQPGETA